MKRKGKETNFGFGDVVVTSNEGIERREKKERKWGKRKCDLRKWVEEILEKCDHGSGNCNLQGF